jgi:DtxR family Mn-dependent transcriptional regulator
MPSPTVEDYVRAVYVLEQEAPDGAASVTRLAATLGVTKGSVSAMVRKLKDADLAEAEPYGGVRLTAKGRRLALDMVRRHRLIEVFLVEKLGFDWGEVHEEAHRLEHAMSAKVLDRLDAFLGHPATDPHGAPIPDAGGKLDQAPLTPLADLAKDDRGVVARVNNQAPEFLDFAAAHGLRPGAPIRITDVSPQDQAITVEARGQSPVSLSLDAARAIQIQTKATDRRKAKP